MSSYPISPVTGAWKTLPAPSADAWLQPIGGAVYVSTDATPSKATAGFIPEGTPYPVSSGVAVKVAAKGPAPVSLRMWDKT